MMTVNEVSKLSGVSIRTLHYYDTIGLLHPTEVTEAGYRLYDDAALERLQQILLFRELEFPLKEIKGVLDAPNFDRNKALEQQIELLTLKKEHLENLINFARGIKKLGVKHMDFSAFDTRKIDEYSERAKEQWGKTDAYKDYEQKAAGQSKVQQKNDGEALMAKFAEVGALRHLSPDSPEVQEAVAGIQTFITQHYYNCTKQIFAGLGQMYIADERFRRNIDSVGGDGTAEFVSRAIEIYCK